MSTSPIDLTTWTLVQLEAADRLVVKQRKQTWREWLDQHFRRYTTAPFAERHLRFWEWVSSLQPNVRPRPRVEVWPRGGAKSTTVELGMAFLGSRSQPIRNYVLYVSETQDQADKHVQSIATMLEDVGIRRATNEYGSSRGWRRQELRTANGFNITAFGLDVGMRGVKLGEFRPDVIVFDDIDDRHDTPEKIKKKIDVITTTVLPAGSTDCAIVIVQNKIAKDSIVSQLCDGRADFLHDRYVAVEPAVNGLTVEQRIQPDGTPRYMITGGTATWGGQSLEISEQQIKDWGLGAFLREAQHEVDEVEGGLWKRDRDIDPWRTTMVPDLTSIVVSVDPNTTGRADEAGIIVAGKSRYFRGDLQSEPHGYVLADRTVSGGPKAWAEAAVSAYHVYEADDLVAESNQGGEMVEITISTIEGAPPVTLVHASKRKKVRAEPVQKLYEDGRVHHVGVFPELETELCSWEPEAGMPSPDRLDACVHGLTHLLITGPTQSAVQSDSYLSSSSTTPRRPPRRRALNG